MVLRRLLTIFLFCAFLVKTNAQLPIGSTAPDFTVTDINGVSHHLYDYLDQGIAVFIDFSATWCGPCWNYHTAHHLKNIYDKYGPSTSGQVMVLFLEGDPSTGMAQLQGQGGGTQGDWLTGTPYPVIDLPTQTLLNQYQITGFPTVFGVCPDRKIFINQAYNQEWLEHTMKQDCAATLRPSIFTQLLGTTDETCPGRGNGEIAISVDGYFPPYDVYWDNGMIGSAIDGLISGSYSANVYDSEGFVIEVGPFTIDSETDGISASVVEVVDADCETGPGSISIDIADGTPPYLFQWSNGADSQNIDEVPPGMYDVTVTDANECRAFLEDIEVGGSNVPVAVTQEDAAFPCVGSFMRLDGGGSSFGQGYTVAWSTEDGSITSGANSLYPFVNAPGTYTLTVSNADDCTATSSVTIFEPETPEVIIADIPLLNCVNECVTIDASASALGLPVEASWTTLFGDDTIEGDDTLTPEVCEPGIYRISLTNTENNCSEVMTINVAANYAEPQANTSIGSPLTCAAATGVISGIGSSTGDNITYTWTSTDGNIIGATDQLDAEIDAPGTYTLTVLNEASECMSESTIVVEPNLDFPEAIVATPDLIDCTNTSIILDASASTSQSALTYEWTTQNGNLVVAANSATPTVNAPGTYTLLVTNESGCTDETSVVVEETADLPSVGLNADPITCINSSTTIQTESDMDVTYIWTGPSITGNNATQANPTVTEGGTYEVVATAANGCTTVSTIEVAEDTVEPTLEAIGGTLDCNNTEVVLQAISDTENLSFEWSGMGIVAGGDTPMATVTQAGEYSVTAMAENGCFTQIVLVVEEDTTLPDVSVQANDNVITCENNEVQLAGTSLSADSFLWEGPNDFSSDLANISVNMAGEYTLTAIGANGCTNTASIVIVEDTAIPTVSASGGTITCVENEVTLEVQTNANNATYTWTGPGINGMNTNVQSPAVSISGTYEVVVTTQNGCTASASAIVEQDADIPEVNASGGTITCENSVVQLTGMVSDTDATIQWTNTDGFNSTELNPTVSESGLYTLVATLPNGCTAASTAQVNADTNIPTININDGLITCNTPQVTLNVTTDDEIVSYEWTGVGLANVTAPTVEVTQVGEYSVTAIAENGCTVTETVFVEEDTAIPQIEANIEGGFLSCANESVQLICLSANDVSYLWEGANGFTSTESTIETSEAGTFIATVVAPNGCTNSLELIVEEDFQTPQIVLSDQTIPCTQNTMPLSATIDMSDVTYQWTGPGIDVTNQTNSNPEVGEAGTYTLIATAANGCSAEAMMQVTTEPGVVATFTGVETPTCADMQNGYIQVEVNTGTAPYIYTWSNGGQDAFIENVAPGTYILTISDANGCIDVLETVLTAPQAMEITTQSTAESSYQGNNGTAAVEVTFGTPPYSFQWASSVGPLVGNTGSLDGLSPGDYTCVVTDANNCTQEANLTIDAFQCAFAAEVVTTSVSCANGEDGSAEIMILSDSEVTTYAWSNGSVQSSADNLAAGTHTVEILDEYNCPLLLEFTVSTPDPIQTTLDIQNESDFQAADGSVSISVAGGTPPYDLQWSNGSTDNTLEGLGAGTYTCLVTDANGCTYEEVVSIASAAVDCSSLSLDYVIQNPLCHGDNTGSIATEISGTYGEYDLSWSNDATTPSLENIDAGNYTLTVEDEAGCVLTETVSITQPSELIVQLASSGGNCSETATVVAVATGGTAPYNYLWNNGTTDTQLTNLEPGEYTVTVQDANDCEDVQSITVDAGSPSMVLSTQVQQLSCADINDAVLTVVVEGGTPPYTYNWDGFDSTESTLGNVGAGDYFVMVTDSEGCQIGTILTVTPPTPVEATYSIHPISGVFVATLHASGGTPPYTYQWSDGHTGVLYENILQGEYIVTITDANGCTTTTTVSVGTTSVSGIPTLTELELFPNPVRDVLRINAVLSEPTTMQVQLFDLLGQEHIHQIHDTHHLQVGLSVQDLPAGTYLLRLQTDKGAVIEKVVVGR